jgi:hypothetical protein
MHKLEQLTPQQKNILAVYAQATTVEQHNGSLWYSRAREAATELSKKYNCTIEAVVGVIAALSPNVRWEKNLAAAEELIKAYTYDLPLDTLRLPCYKTNVLKAWEILSGSPPLTVLRGNKVTHFYSCILYGYGLCVDGHAYCVWYGSRMSIREVPRISDKMYNQVAYDYHTVASELGIPAHQLQAITWCVWRRMHEV